MKFIKCGCVYKILLLKYMFIAVFVINIHKTLATPEDRKKDTSIDVVSTTGAGCQIPADREHLIITHFQSGDHLLPGQTVAVNTIVSYKCDPTYNLVGESKSFCETDGWTWEVPSCTQYCSYNEVTRGVSTYVTLTYKNIELKENDPIPPGTIATFRCAFGYTDLQYTTLQCTDKAQWDSKKPICLLDCGAVTPKITAFAKNGVNTSITEVPWHVGIYSNFKRDVFSHICGGTVIAAKLVVSAAHCFWDGANADIFNASYYMVGAGKYYRDYDSLAEPFTVQKIPIKEIVVELYNDLAESYRNDIALLILENELQFTHSIKPICLEFQKVESQIVGFFAGWGITDDNRPSTVLQTVAMTTMSYSDCTQYLNDTKTSYELPDDKFCISNLWGGTACRGDSGGGFVVKRQTSRFNAPTRFFLSGIISHAPVQAQDCGKDTVVALTNIQYFQNLLTKYMPQQELVNDNDGAGCEIPTDRDNLIITRYGSESQLQPGQKVSAGTIVSYKCKPTYNIVGKTPNYCKENSVWDYDVPICTKHCSRKEITGYSTNYTLTYKYSILTENDSIEDGTVANFKCAFGYTNLRSQQRTDPYATLLWCTDKATWDRKKPTCEQDCGLVSPKSDPNSNITEMPWHVGVYRNIEPNAFKLVCGGTIITAKLVISAAHCFWDKANKELYDQLLFKVAAGKQYRDYDSASEPFEVQKMSIANAFFEMANDFSIIVLENNLIFTQSIQPICLDFLALEKQNVESNIVGVMAGDNNSSSLLRTVDTTTLSRSDCRNYLKYKRPKYELPDDKFCASNELGTACRGDGGSGFYVKKSNRYFLTGIINQSPVKQHFCAKDHAVVLTNIQYFKKLIEEIMAEQENDDNNVA